MRVVNRAYTFQHVCVSVSVLDPLALHFKFQTQGIQYECVLSMSLRLLCSRLRKGPPPWAHAGGLGRRDAANNKQAVLHHLLR